MGDLLDLGVADGVIDKSGAWFSFQGERIGQGRENAKTFLEDYITALREVAADLKKAEKEARGEVKEGPKTEEEEEEEFKNRSKKWKEDAKKNLRDVFDRAFGDWNEAMWRKLEGSFRKYIS